MRMHCLKCSSGFDVVVADPGNVRNCPQCNFPVKIPKEILEPKELQPRQATDYLISAASTAAIHAVVLMVLAFVYWDFARGEGPGEAGGMVGVGQLPAEELTERSEAELDIGEAFATEENMELDDTFAEIAPPAVATEGDPIPTPLAVASGGASGGPSGAEFNTGSAQGSGGGFGLGVNFMGVEARGRFFCVIADRSGSMFGRKLNYVKAEIMETLKSLPVGARFHVIFYNGAALPFPSRKWLTRANAPFVKKWLTPITAEGTTSPYSSFVEAFAMTPKPDVIFFMTDGQFTEGDVPTQIARLNSRTDRKVVVHTISFIDRSTEPEMRKIAKDSGGKYRHVAGF